MNNSKIISTKILLLFLIAFLPADSLFGQQTITEINFKEEKGYYVIKYYWDDDPNNILKGTVMPGDNVKPLITLEVKKANNHYKYSYTIKNAESALLPLYTFAFKSSSKPIKIETPNDDWYGRYVLPNQTISWDKVGDQIPGIKSGNSEQGFMLLSNRLPGIVKGFFSNYMWFSFNSEENGPIGRIEYVADSLTSSRKSVELEIVGPVFTTENESEFIYTIKSYLQRSCEELGWITNQGICNSLEVKLQNTKRHLEDDKPKQAANTLNAFLNEVEAQKDKALSSEAYALLYFNGQYLLEKLKANEE